MFATWKFDPETQEVQNIRQAFDPDTARSSQHQACNRCHEKKLKCSGDKDACSRCVSQGLSCVYGRSVSRNSKRAKKAERQSSCSSFSEREASASPISTTASIPSPTARPGRGRRCRILRSSGSSRPPSVAEVPDAGTTKAVNLGPIPNSGVFQMNMSPTTQGEISSFETAPMSSYPLHAGAPQVIIGEYQDSWMLDSADSPVPPSMYPYLPESNVIYGSTSEYPESAHYESYTTHPGSGVDPRFWDQDMYGHLATTTVYNDATA